MGGLLYDKEGLNIPESIQLESQRYRREEDDMADFFLECCKQGEEYQVGATEIFNVYFEWCKENLNFEPKQANFGRQMTNLFEKFKRGTYFYRGIRLLDKGETPDKDELMDSLDRLDGINETSPEGKEQGK